MNKKPFIVIVLLVVIGAGVYYQQRRSADSGRSTTLYGNVDIRQVSLAFRVTGRVADVMVDEGAVVRQGELLATLDAEPLRNTVRGAEAAVAALTARNALLHNGYRAEDVEQLRSRIQGAKAQLVEAERTYKRQKDLVVEGAAAQRELDAAESQRDQAQAQLKTLAEQLRLLNNGFRREEIAESDAQLSQAQSNLEVARLALRDATLLAPEAGVIITRAVERGSMVQAGAPAFSLSLTRPVWVRAYVNEPQLGRFPCGAKVVLTTDGQPEKTYNGVVGFVSPTAEFTPKTVETTDLRTSLVYRLRIVVDNPDAQLRQGMPVTIRLGA